MTTNDGVSGARMAGEERRLQILAVAVSLFSNPGLSGHHHEGNYPGGWRLGGDGFPPFRHQGRALRRYSRPQSYALSHESFEPEKMADDAIQRKDDRAVFESLAIGALGHHENDRDFQRLLLHRRSKHELAQMFFDQFVRRVYEFLGSYIRERQREGAFIEIDPAIVVRCFIGMVMHHSLNNNFGIRIMRC